MWYLGGESGCRCCWCPASQWLAHTIHHLPIEAWKAGLSLTYLKRDQSIILLLHTLLILHSWLIGGSGRSLEVESRQG